MKIRPLLPPKRKWSDSRRESDHFTNRVFSSEITAAQILHLGHLLQSRQEALLHHSLGHRFGTHLLDRKSVV